MERVTITEPYYRPFYKRISWGSIFAGVATVLAISILLSVLGTSIGLFMLDPQDSDPTSGIGTTVSIWTAVALLISLAAGGFVAGKLATRDGMIHGFVVWATSLIITVLIGAWLAVGAVKLTGNILGSVSSVAGNVISGVGSVVGGGVSAVADGAGELFDDMNFQGDMSKREVRQEIRQALRKSGVREFQPEYLERQVKAIRSDLGRSAKRLMKNPKDANRIVDRFLERTKQRTDVAFQNVNRDDLTRAIANNSSMSKAEVDRAVDEYTEIINNGIEEAKEQVANLQQSIEEMKQEWESAKQQALVKADEMSNAAARSALISFFALLFGAGISGACGLVGARKTREGYEV